MQLQAYPVHQHRRSVSILTRAFARVQLPPGTTFLASGFQSSLELSHECNQRVSRSRLQALFQSSLELSHECNFRRMLSELNGKKFQSSLELSHECNLNPCGRNVIGIMFQSSLELSHECNLAVRAACCGCTKVSILTRAFARVQRDGGETGRQDNVSILTRAFARVQPA